MGAERRGVRSQDRPGGGGDRQPGGPLPGKAHSGAVFLLRRRKNGGRSGGLGQLGGLPEERGQPRGGRGAQLPHPGGAGGGGGQVPHPERLSRRGPVRGAVPLVWRGQPQRGRRGDLHDAGGCHPHRRTAALPVLPALGHLYRHLGRGAVPL